jgi:preprotein translocase subunit SecD
MNRYAPWRYVLLAVLIIIAIIYALPNLYGEDPAVQISATEISASGNTETQASSLDSRVTDALKAKGMTHLSFQTQNHSLLVRFQSADDQLKAQNVIQKALGNDYSVALSLAPRTPAWLRAIGARPMKLGLDLRGGIHFLLDVKTDELIKKQQSDDMRQMALNLRKAAIPYQDITAIQKKGTSSINIHFEKAENRDQSIKALQKDFPDYRFVSSGLNVQTTEILETRINELGVAEPVVQQQGLHYISVDLPGVQDAALAKDIIGKVATLEFKLVDTEHDAETAHRTGNIPPGSKLFYMDTGEPVLLKNDIILKGTSIIRATSTISQQDGRPAVAIRVSGSDVSAFNRITAQNVGKPLATVYIETKTVPHQENGKTVLTYQTNERVINVATISSALGNSFEVNHLSTPEYAKQLALLLRSGAYPVSVGYVEQTVVGPSLGKENIRAGVLSTLIGSLLVIIFVAFYYRLFGLIADLALLLDIVFVVAILSMLGATLTLPGIAGIVLTVGMAIDANVLINERIREELRNGMSPQASIKTGYDRAFLTIVDTHVTTLIVMVILFALGSGAVKGFAITTTIGLLASMLTAISCTRAVVNLVYGRRSVSHLSIGIKTPKFAKPKKREA